MFGDEVLYPEYDPELVQYKHEVEILTKYLNEIYGP
jgi:hypothetical protein